MYNIFRSFILSLAHIRLPRKYKDVNSRLDNGLTFGTALRPVVRGKLRLNAATTALPFLLCATLDNAFYATNIGHYVDLALYVRAFSFTIRCYLKCR